MLYVTSMAQPPLPRFPEDNQLRGSLFAIYDSGRDRRSGTALRRLNELHRLAAITIIPGELTLTPDTVRRASCCRDAAE
ncbi:hypothetical protein J4733_12195 [Klebsiella pneumoniae]|uniref:Uncharacterized protein n=1 Tax=Klebsiella pneumoniae TaxID=573 RepID=A0A939SRV1_KLEPN|nr:hypothetical protein [Klebsiella pneumoniae]